MAVLQEGDLQIELPNGVQARKFDGDEHELSHCMKAVDLIIELDDRFLFIEMKDPDAPDVPQPGRAEFLRKFESDILNNELKQKYRDSFLYEWASGRANKPIYFLVLLGMETLDAAALLSRTDALRRQLPAKGPANRPWVRPFVAGCAVMNLAAWNETMATFPAARISEGG